MAAPQPSSIRRTSSGSLLVSRPPAPAQRRKWPPEDEIIPDSEEERLNEERARKNGNAASTEYDSDVQVISVSLTKKLRDSLSSVIVISSDDEEKAVPHSRGLVVSGDPFVAESTGYKPDTAPGTHKGKGKAPQPALHVEGDADSSVISVHDTDSEPSSPQPSTSVKQKVVKRTLTPREPVLNSDLEVASDDSAILTFDPPARPKPVATTPGPKSKPKPTTSSKPKAPASAPATPRKRKVKPEQLRLEEYARTLFAELNAAVFDNGMPVGTELIWNARLATTAGRAFWSINRFGETSSRIELSPKVVDSDERVRYTLSHEMCHLAVWVLNNDPYEQGHGPQFKSWAARVMKARPDITISTRHTYEINYQYRWECCACGVIYGRHSKSLDHTTHSCGECDPPGRLKPLFETRPKRTPKAASTSRLASSSPRGSPRAIVDRAARGPTKLANPSSPEEDEVEELINGLAGVDL